MPDPAIEVRAAGGVVVHPDDDSILVIHRPRYDDWSLPKGKLEAGESFEAAARREVEEETGLRCDLGPSLSSIDYRDHERRPKTVRYWLMTVSSGSPDPSSFTPNDEVDRIAWVTVDQATELLTYSTERALLRRHQHELTKAFRQHDAR